MQYKIIDESPWQILSNAMTIGPSSTGYQLQVAADGRNYTTLFTVGAGITRQITNLSSGSYFRMKGNVGEVTVNWVRDCSGGGGGEGGNAGELEPVTAFPVGAPEGTVVALASGDSVGVYQYDGSDWVAVGGGSPFDPTQYYTKSQTDAAITAATEDLASEEYVDEQVSGVTEYIEDVERVTATALTELHTDVLALSAATPDMSDYYTKSEVDSEITAATENMVTTGDIADMVTTGDIQNFVTSGDVATQISTATADMVESQDVKHIVKLTQAQYDALATKDPHTFYVITGS